MTNQLSQGLLFSLTLFVIACNPKETRVVAPLRAETIAFEKKFCVADTICAIFDVTVPQISGGDSSVTAAVNHSVQSFVRSTVGAGESPSFTVAMDSAAAQMISAFKQSRIDIPDIPMGYSMEIKGATPMLTTKVATMYVDGYSFMGGAHPNPFTTVVSYDLLQGGKALSITSMVADTNAVRPLLEAAYKEAKGMKPEEKITDLLYPELQHLPMPANVAVLPEGLIFFYNAYEVAPYAVGPAEIVLTWEQLGALADRKKWLDTN